MTYAVMTGLRIVVPIDGPWIQHVVDDLLPRAGEQEKVVGQASSQGGPKDLLQSMDQGRIFWRDSSVSTHPGWTIMVQGDDGKKRFKRAGLSVPRRGLSGDALSAEAFLQNAHMRADSSLLMVAGIIVQSRTRSGWLGSRHLFEGWEIP